MDGVCVDFRKAEEAMMRLRLAIGRGVLMMAMAACACWMQFRQPNREYQQGKPREVAKPEKFYLSSQTEGNPIIGT